MRRFHGVRRLRRPTYRRNAPRPWHRQRCRQSRAWSARGPSHRPVVGQWPTPCAMSSIVPKRAGRMRHILSTKTMLGVPRSGSCTHCGQKTAARVHLDADGKGTPVLCMKALRAAVTVREPRRWDCPHRYDHACGVLPRLDGARHVFLTALQPRGTSGEGCIETQRACELDHLGLCEQGPTAVRARAAAAPRDGGRKRRKAPASALLRVLATAGCATAARPPIFA